METDDEENENLSPIAHHVRQELRKISKQKSDDVSILEFHAKEAQTRTHYDDNIDYLGAGPSYRNLSPDRALFFKRQVADDAQSAKPKPTHATFIYKMSLGYSDPAQVDQLKKALFESSTVLLEGTREPSQDLTKLLQLLREAHPVMQKSEKEEIPHEERKSEAIEDMVAANHPCLVYKMKIKCHDMDQIKTLEKALLDTSVILFSCVSPSPAKAEASEPSVKMQVKQRIKDIFNLGPL